MLNPFRKQDFLHELAFLAHYSDPSDFQELQLNQSVLLATGPDNQQLGGGGIQTAEITELHLEERPTDLQLGSITTCQLHATAGVAQAVSTDD